MVITADRKDRTRPGQKGADMFAEERQRQIADLATHEGRVSVGALAERFRITKETVRRDLAALEDIGTLRRVHGGAVARDKRSMAEPSLGERTGWRAEEKARIAAAALSLIPASSTGSVVLDAGTTTERLAGLLVDWSPSTPGDELLVITNAVPIAYLLAGNDRLALELIGGRLRGLTRAAVGHATVSRFEAVRPDIAFVGANGVHPEFGFSTPDSLEAAVKSAIVASARRVVALVDSSKLHEETLVRFAHLDEIDTLITDAAPDAELAAALEAADVEVMIA